MTHYNSMAKTISLFKKKKIQWYVVYETHLKSKGSLEVGRKTLPWEHQKKVDVVY